MNKPPLYLRQRDEECVSKPAHDVSSKLEQEMVAIRDDIREVKLLLTILCRTLGVGTDDGGVALNVIGPAKAYLMVDPFDYMMSRY
jgi:hypothetical protein